MNSRPGEEASTAPEPADNELDSLIEAIPEGWSRTQIGGEMWAVTRSTRAGGKAVSINAERLGDAEQLSTNVWFTSEGTLLKPCEVPAERVMRFLRAAAAAYSDGATA